jgi:hypothetical protein
MLAATGTLAAVGSTRLPGLLGVAEGLADRSLAASSFRTGGSEVVQDSNVTNLGTELTTCDMALAKFVTSGRAFRAWLLL